MIHPIPASDLRTEDLQDIARLHEQKQCWWFGDEDGGDFVWVGTAAELETHRDNWASDGLRCEWADAFEGKPIPAELMLAHGFRFECDHCYRMLNADGPIDWGFDSDEEADSDAPAPITQGPWVWCNSACRDAWQARIDRLRDYRLSVEARYPFATHVRAFNGSPGKCECFRKDHENLAADISFPGGRYDAQTCNGCGNLWVSKCDVEVWRELVSGHKYFDQSGQPIAQGAD